MELALNLGTFEIWERIRWDWSYRWNERLTKAWLVMGYGLRPWVGSELLTSCKNLWVHFRREAPGNSNQKHKIAEVSYKRSKN